MGGLGWECIIIVVCLIDSISIILCYICIYVKLMTSSSYYYIQVVLQLHTIRFFKLIC